MPVDFCQVWYVSCFLQLVGLVCPDTFTKGKGDGVCTALAVPVI